MSVCALETSAGCLFYFICNVLGRCVDPLGPCYKYTNCQRSRGKLRSFCFRRDFTLRIFFFPPTHKNSWRFGYITPTVCMRLSSNINYESNSRKRTATAPGTFPVQAINNFYRKLYTFEISCSFSEKTYSRACAAARICGVPNVAACDDKNAFKYVFDFLDNAA